MNPETMQHGKHISISVLASTIPVLLAVWFFIKPAVVLAVGEELQEQVQQTVAAEVRPINVALGVMLQNAVANISRQIAAMEFRRDFPPIGDWSNADAQELTNLELNLKSNVTALAALVATTTP